MPNNRPGRNTPSAHPERLRDRPCEASATFQYSVTSNQSPVHGEGANSGSVGATYRRPKLEDER
jgi:hypothetical protein